MSFQEFIAEPEMIIPEESTISAKRTWMRRLQNEMRWIRDKRFLASGITSPEDEHTRLVIFSKCPDRVIGEYLPPLP